MAFLSLIGSPNTETLLPRPFLLLARLGALYALAHNTVVLSPRNRLTRVAALESAYFLSKHRVTLRAHRVAVTFALEPNPLPFTSVPLTKLPFLSSKVPNVGQCTTTLQPFVDTGATFVLPSPPYILRRLLSARGALATLVPLNTLPRH